METLDETAENLETVYDKFVPTFESTQVEEKSNSSTTKVPLWLNIAILACLGGANLANYYVYDIPQAMQRPFRDSLGLTTEQNQQLYTVYSIPNMFLPFFGGIQITMIGDKLSILLFSGLVFVGNFVFFIGIWFGNFPLMLIGRIVFGLGGENILSAQMVCTEKWFSGKFQAAAMGMNMVCSYAGSLQNNFLTPYIYSSLNSTFHTMVVIMFIQTFSMISVYLYIILDMKYEHILKRSKSLNISSETPNLSAQDKKNGFKFKDIFRLPIEFWLICGSALTTTCAYYSFTAIGTDYFETRYYISYDTAAVYNSGVSLVVIVFQLFFSNLVTRIGCKGLMLMISAILACLGYLVIYFIVPSKTNGSYCAFLPMIFIGIWFALYQASYWPSISNIVDDHVNSNQNGINDQKEENQLSGVAFGITNMINNIGLSVYPILFGWFNSPPTGESYRTSTLFLAAQALLGAIFLTLQFVKDYRGKQIIHKSTQLEYL